MTLVRHLLAFLLCLAVVDANALLVSLSAEADGRDKPAIFGATNLPDGTRLKVVLSREESSYRAQEWATVSHGRFRTGVFADGSAPLNAGRYTVEISTRYAGLQPPAVSTAMGDLGSSLSGPLISRSRVGGNVVRYSTTVQVGSGTATAQADRAARSRASAESRTRYRQICRSTCEMGDGQRTLPAPRADARLCYERCVANDPAARP